MRRREFISFLGGAAAWPAVVRAQVSTKRPLIVWLSGGGQSASQVFVDAFLKGMRELGYVERSNFDIVYRYADGYVERLPPLAEELVRLQPNVILAPASGPAVAAKNATSSIPIVTPALADAVHLGLIASESRPGGNVTGIAPYVAGLPAKQMELAREVVPGAVKIGVVTNLDDPKAPPQRQELESAGRGLGVNVIASDVRTPDDLEAAFKFLVRQCINVMIVLQTSMLLTERRRIAALAASARTPAIYGYREHVDDGGLASYGVDLRECFHRGAYFVDKIPKGASPSDLPDGDELPSAAAQPSVKNETLLAGKDSSAGVTAPKATSVPTGQPSITSETTGGRGVRDYRWGAAFIVMIMWLLIVLFGVNQGSWMRCAY